MTKDDLLHAETYRDRVSTVTNTGKRKWVYALKPKGKWYNLRSILAYTYLGVFFIMPFIKVNGMPFLMINVVKGRFILFTKIFWPQDFFIFAIGMITLIIFIVLFTVVFGRLFCGWICPQTIFMEFVFRPIEWLIEGSPSQQKKLEASGNKNLIYRKKVLKHIVFILISFIVAHTFLAYIFGIDEVLKLMHEPLSENFGVLFGLIIFTFLFYSVYAYIREIVCTTICPYGRLQGVMVDRDTVQVSYDYKRGEPREKLHKKEVRTEGDCINCHKCVQVCPTGIDIRDGVQMECVGCTACIDACNEVMTAINFKTGLIRYASENQISKNSAFKFNNRMKGYTVLLSGLLILMVILIATSKSISTTVNKVRGQLFQELPNGNFSNIFEAKTINKTRESFPITLKIINYKGEVKPIGNNEIMIKPEALTEFNFYVELPDAEIKKRSTEIKIGVFKGEEQIEIIKTTFLGPFK